MTVLRFLFFVDEPREAESSFPEAGMKYVFYPNILCRLVDRICASDRQYNPIVDAGLVLLPTICDVRTDRVL